MEQTPFECRSPGYDCTLQIDEERPERTSPPLLEYLSVIQAAKMLPYWMKDQGRWSEAFLAVVIDGMVVGRGGILRRP